MTTLTTPQRDFGLTGEQTDGDIRALSFSTPNLPVRVFQNGGHVEIGSRAIVVNPDVTPVPFYPSGLRDHIAPLGAAFLREVSLRSDTTLVTLALDRLSAPADLCSAPGWRRLDTLPGMASVPGAAGLPLFRSPRDRVTTIQATPDRLAPTLPPGPPQCWGVFMNLWFAPAGTACLIHNSHPFLEYHVQISGDGAMQKFRRNDPSTLYENQYLAPGAAHGIYAVQPAGDGSFLYPWHQYVARTDCLWLAVELVPEGPAPRPQTSDTHTGQCCHH